MDAEQIVKAMPTAKLAMDLRKAGATLEKREARFLVDLYYQIQDDRIRAAHQTRALTKSKEPHDTVQWFGSQFDNLEPQMKAALGYYAAASPIGQWSQSITGIGPVISAGLLAYIDVTKAQTAGDIWRYAGLDPTVTWKKKHKRPWNAGLKKLCYKIGDCFIKVQNNENDFYGKLYVQRRALEDSRNEAGLFADQAAHALATKDYDKDTEAYKWYIQGKLPPAHCLARARRWTVKLFLSHWHHVAYWHTHGQPPPKPFVIEHMGHVHFIPVPNWEEPQSPREPGTMSEPRVQSEPNATSEPKLVREPPDLSEPSSMSEPVATSEPTNNREPQTVSEPILSREPDQLSEPMSQREPVQTSEPK